MILKCDTWILHPFLWLSLLIGFQCLISTTPCNFKRPCIGNFACLNYFNKVLIIFKAHPRTLWDEPHPSCENPNDAQ